MNLYFHPKIKELASLLPVPLYAVGGYVRNFLIDGSIADDVDLAAPIEVEELMHYLEKLEMPIVALYKRTGTVVFSDGKVKYEFTSFRKDEYSEGGAHSPDKTSFTDDIVEDAKRRDFKCNAVYYDIKEQRCVDPLKGAVDIVNKTLDTVVSPERVFGHDGLRLMRLARFSAELNFKPTTEVLEAVKANAKNIKDISVERVYDELKRILISDTKYNFSDKLGHYHGVKILSDTGVLDYIIPELTDGRGMAQRSDYHSYDVLEHSLRACMYAKPSVRLVALVHDVAKPYCKNNYGKFSGHAEKGGELVEGILKRLKVDNKTIKRVKFLTTAHMFDLGGDESDGSVRKFLVKNLEYVDDLMLLNQADHSAHKDDLGECPSVTRWKFLIAKMKTDGTPMRLKDLAVTANDLSAFGIKPASLGKALEYLWERAIVNPKVNQKITLLALLKEDNNF